LQTGPPKPIDGLIESMPPRLADRFGTCPREGQLNRLHTPLAKRFEAITSEFTVARAAATVDRQQTIASMQRLQD
jgi:hypothetical protein